MPNELAIRKMMEACDQDPKLKARLFHDPAAVAKENGVELSDNEVQQLKRVGALIGLVNEFKAGRVGGRGPVPGYPIGYPIDQWWKGAIFNHVIIYRSLYNPLFNPIFYPIGYVFNVAGKQFSNEIVAALRLRTR
jgi:hypothetical protein